MDEHPYCVIGAAIDAHAKRPVFGCVLFLLGTLACSQVEAEPLGSSANPIVYGADDRRELFELHDGRLRRVLTEVAMALMVRGTAPSTSGTVEFRAPLLGDAQELCDGEPFVQQPAAARCSGVLVTEQMVLTAGHCLLWVPCDKLELVRGYSYAAPGVLNFRGAHDVYRCERVVEMSLQDSAVGRENDFAWVLLDRPVADFVPAIEFRPRTESFWRNESVTVAGFGAGVPLKVDSGARVTEPRSRADDYFVASSDTFSASSGSPVFDAGYRLAGIHVSGLADYTRTAAGCLTIARRAPEDAGEAATYAASALKPLCVSDPGYCCDSFGVCDDAIWSDRASGPPQAGCHAAVDGRGSGYGASKLAIAFMFAVLCWARRARCRRIDRTTFTNQRLGI